MASLAQIKCRSRKLAAFLGIALPAVSFLPFFPAAWAQDSPTLPINIFEIQTRAQALMDKARRLGDIHSPNAPAFRLEATFSFVGSGLETQQGTYSEIWVSRSKWRRETTVGNWRRIQVADTTRIYQLDNQKGFPPQAARLPSLTNAFPPAPESLKYASLSDPSESNTAAQCAVSEPDSPGGKTVFVLIAKKDCLSKKLFARSAPETSSPFPASTTHFTMF